MSESEKPVRLHAVDEEASSEAPAQATPAEPSGDDEAAAAEEPQAEKRYVSNFLPMGRPVAPELAEAVAALEKSLGKPVWLLAHGMSREPVFLDLAVVEGFRRNKSQLEPGKSVALLIDSPGGYAGDAFRLARLLQRRCGSFDAVIPRNAKSAATLLSLGAATIRMAPDAELGPLDAQIMDHDREAQISALDEVQALERLNAASISALDQTMFLLSQRSRKKTDTLLPMALSFTADLMRPLFEKIDAVHYNQMSREVKVAEEYASRLLHATCGEQAKRIARQLVGHYPEHGFVIDFEEAKQIGLPVELLTDEQAEQAEAVLDEIDCEDVVGRIVEETDDE